MSERSKLISDSKESNLYELFHTKYYSVDDYQREYSWGDEQVTEFCMDIMSCYQNNDDQYFFGSLILRKLKEEKGKKYYEIVDGQQRISTFKLLIATLLGKVIETKKNIENVIFDKIKEVVLNLNEEDIKGILLHCIRKYLNNIDNDTVENDYIYKDSELFKEISNEFDDLDFSDSMKIINNKIMDLNNKKKIEECIEFFKLEKDLDEVQIKLKDCNIEIELNKVDEKLFKVIIKNLKLCKDINTDRLRDEIQIHDSQFQFNTTSHKLILDCTQKINEIIISKFELSKERINILEDISIEIDKICKFINYILYSVYFVPISTEKDLANALTLFDIMNDRGLELDVFDHMKRLTISKVNEVIKEELITEEEKNILLKESSKEISNKWNIISKNATFKVEKPEKQRQAKIKFLRIYLNSLKGEEFSTYKLHDYLYNNYFANLNTVNEVKKEVEEITKFSNLYKSILNYEVPYNDKFGDEKNFYNYQMKFLLSTLKHSLCVPLLLAITRTGDISKIKNAILSLQKIAFRYIIVGDIKPNVISPIYNQCIRNINDTGNFNLKLFFKPFEDKGHSEVFKENLLKKLYYKKGNNNYLKYFLIKLEENIEFKNLQEINFLKKPNKDVKDLKSAHIEHIYPQTPDPNDRYFDNTNNEFFTQKVDDVENKNRIGNLCLLNQIPNCRNKQMLFKLKSSTYKSSEYSITKFIGNHFTEWNEYAFYELQNKFKVWGDTYFKEI